MDKIVIKSLKINTIVGVNESERHNLQDIFLTVTLYTSFEQCAQTDDITHTTNYSWVAVELAKLVQSVKAKTIEFLAHLVCNWLLSSCGDTIRKVKVQIDKPAAIKEAQFATVITKRERSSLDASPSGPAQPSGPAPYPSSLSASSSKAPFAFPKTSPASLFEAVGVDFCGNPRLPLPTKSTKASIAAVDLTYLAIGSNVGCRSRNIHLAIDKVREIANVRHVSFLYETPAAYVTDQPSFLNCAISVETNLSPQDLLKELKRIETDVGRQPTYQYGPRVIDLDIVTMGSLTVNDSNLIIPHALMHERSFVLVPLADICPPGWNHPRLNKSLKQIYSALAPSEVHAVKRVIPTYGDNDEETLIEVQEGSKVRLFGVLNATPDSFSDGGLNLDASEAAKNAARMIESDETVILDVGGETTKPGSAAVSAEVELSRIQPVIAALKDLRKTAPKTLISVDTNKHSVAKTALETLGCHILNDVYAVPRFYSERDAHDKICELVRSTRKLWVVMHCRGTSLNMTTLASYDAGKVTSHVVAETIPVIRSILESGVLPWQLIVDPGIGFAKLHEHNTELLRDISSFKSGLGDLPVLVGASRKRFLGALLGKEQAAPETRDSAGLALIPPLIASGVNFIRVHDIPSASDVRLVYDKIWRS